MKMQYRFFLLFFCLAVIFFSGCATSRLKQQSGGNKGITGISQTTAVPASVFTECHELAFAEIGKSVFVKEWYAVPVTSGKPLFNPLFLAFKYSCHKGDPDPGQALTFPSLLAFKFDFVPDNFNASHPFFVFRKDPVLMNNPSPDRDQLQACCRSWDATHVVSGELIQEGSQYAGSIRIADTEDNTVYERHYKTPENYFALMGKMVQGWMEYRKQKISPGLSKELYRPMTKDMMTLRWLGKTFTEQWGSTDEWEIYDKILKNDPGFGEVQYWYANEKGWVTGNYTDSFAGKGKALLDHPVIPALREFSTELCLDDKLNADYSGTVQFIKTILGDVPLISYLNLKDHGKSMPAAALDTFIPLVLEHPSYYSLIELLAYQYDIRNQYEKALPLFLSALDSGYSPADGKFDTVYSSLSGNFRELGYINEAAHFCLQALKYCRESRRPYLLEALGYTFSESFSFDKAAGFLKESYLANKQVMTLLAGYMNLYLGGENEMITDWQYEAQTSTLKGSPAALVNIRGIISRGDYYPAGTMLAELSAVVADNFSLYLETEITWTDLSLLHKQIDEAKEHATRVWYLMPRSRKTAFLVERSFAEDLISLGYYAEVANRIFKEDIYYRELLQRVKAKGYIPYEDSEVVKQYNAIAEAQAALSQQGEKKFWQSFTPFYIEYFALRLIRMNDAQYKEAAVRLFTAYSKTIRYVSACQEIHLRTFFRILIAGLSKTEKAGWIEVFEYEMSETG